jgi:hypothetical protein
MIMASEQATATAPAPAAKAAQPAAKRPLPDFDITRQNPHEHPIPYLRSRGWRCSGNPHAPGARWYDPTRPLKDTETKEDFKVMGVEVDPDDPEKKKLKPIVVRTIKRVVVHPGAQPMSMVEALDLQLDREFPSEDFPPK